jgi:hypothetical protein
MGFLDRAGVGRDAFDALIVQDADDAMLVTYFDRHRSNEQRESANRYGSRKAGDISTLRTPRKAAG